MTSHPTRRFAGGRIGRTAVIMFVCVEVATFVTFVALDRFAWFNADEWDFLATRSASSPHDLFMPHNEHWSTLPILVYRFLWTTIGLRSYMPYVVLVVGLHLVAAALLRVVMVRAGVGAWIATIVASVFALFGSGYYDIAYGFQIGFSGALVLGLAQLLAADHDGPLARRDWMGLAFGVAALMCSGVGVTMAVVVGLATLMRRGWRIALFHTAPPAATYLVWFATIGHTGYGRRSGPTEAVRFAAHDIWATFVAIGQYGLVAALLAGTMLVGALLIWTGRDAPGRIRAELAAPIALAAGAVVFLLIAGAGRAAPTTGYVRFQQGPAASRYLHITAALLLPALGVAFDAIVRRRRWLVAALVPLLLVGVPGNVQVLAENTYDTRDFTRVYKYLVLALPRVPIARELPRSIRADPFFDPWVTLGWLIDGVDEHRLPSPGTIGPHQVASLSLGLALRPRIRIDPQRCKPVARSELRLVARSQLSITGTVRVRYLPESGSSLPAVVIGTPRQTRWFTVAARSLTLRVVEPVGTRLQVCRAADSAANA